MSAGESRAALSLGSNLGDRELNLTRARAALEAYAGGGRDAPGAAAGAGAAAIEILAASAPRSTAPQGFTAQPDFLNQVLLVRTALSPWELLEACLEVERGLGRVRGPIRWGPRTIDVDVLAYDGLVVRDERLTLPHAALPLRPFFLEMMREIGAAELLP
ncbi:MAG TPA: 2-amino-4-hydroxy-6-hydroxymethyldihydropteridine diphosphokinase [Gemmatimonadota bacterium]|jgi:2-amino-4-hydroxy-6-hydroxymethyldihydropteridine diphosphokinase